MSEKLRDPAEILLSRVPSGPYILTVETIEHEGTFWLVPDWYPDATAGWMWPVRMVSLAMVRHERVDFRDFHIAVREQLPSDWNVSGPARATETAKRTRVLEAPKLLFALPVVQ